MDVWKNIENEQKKCEKLKTLHIHIYNQNKFSLNGTIYVSKIVPNGNSCDGCLFSMGELARLCESIFIPHCESGVRKDKKHVIFVREDTCY
jgi:hypothetical protein